LAIAFFVGLFITPSLGVGQDVATDAAPTVVQIAPAGVRRYEPGAWSTLMINATNKSDSDTDEFVSIYIGDDSQLQFARRFWLPARSRRQTFIPVLIPGNTAMAPGQAEDATGQTAAHVMRLEEADGAESFRGNPRDMNITSQPLLMDYSQTKSGILFHRMMPDESGATLTLDLAAYETVYKAREAAVDSRVLIEFGGDFMPPFSTTLDSLDQLVIRGDRILNDAAGLAMLRQWLFRGGRLWIMLDSTSMETVTAILGNEARCSVVDRLELNEFEIEDLGDLQREPGEAFVDQWSSELPVEMVRVFAGTDDVHCRIDGWPVAFWQKVGDGEVLFTTLGPRGWVHSADPKPALVSIARRFFQTREKKLLEPDVVTPLLNDQIGYRIPSRGLAAWILGLNSLAILSFGCWSARQHRLDRLAWFVPIAAVIAASLFLLIGSRNTIAVPSTIATAQVVRVNNAAQESNVSSVSLVYSQDATELELPTKQGMLSPIRNESSRGAIQRIVWDDNGTSRWMNLRQPPGVVRTFESERTVAHPVPRVAQGTFDSDGFRGSLAGVDAAGCEDATIVAAPALAAAVSMDANGDFRVATRNVLAVDQFIADGLMSDRQRSRQQVLRRLFGSTQGNPFSDDPSLLVWTPLLEMGVDFGASFEQLGAALVSIPIEIERPEAETKVSIPATFIKIRSYVGRQGASSVFNQRTGKWLENATKPTRSQLNCVLPKSLLPLRLNRATVAIKINAPSRTLKIEGVVDGKFAVLHEKANPNGVLRFQIDQAESLELDDEGGFHFAIVVTETVEERAEREGKGGSTEPQFENNTWQIDYVRVDVEGVVR